MLVKKTQVISSHNIDVVMHFYVDQNKFHMTRIKTKQLIVNSCWQTLHVILWYTWIQALSCMSLQYIICPCSPADHCRRWPWVITMETCSETLGFFHHIFISWSSQYCWIVFFVLYGKIIISLSIHFVCIITTKLLCYMLICNGYYFKYFLIR